MRRVFNNLPLSKKLALGFGCILAFMVATTAILVGSFEQVKSHVTLTEKESLPTAFIADQIALNTLRIHQSLVQSAAAFSKDGFRDADAAMEIIRQDLIRLRDIAAEHNDATATTRIDDLNISFEGLLSQGKKMADLYMSQGGIDAAGPQLTAFTDTAKRLNTKVQELAKTNVHSAEENMHGITSILSTVEFTMILFNIIAVCAGAGIAFALSRSVMGVLGGEPDEAMHAVQRIAAGDLSTQIYTRHPFSLMGQMEQMRCRLNEIMAILGTQATQLAEYAHHLTDASTYMANAANQGSDAASSMAATVEQMSVSIGHVSDSASATAETVTATGTIANQSGDVVLNLAKGMASISGRVRDSAQKVAELGRQSENIRSIVATIQEIAGQTNLLALNAAIEAARAGETGRGFAVVADEVRKLAERTAQSTQDIAAMIESIRENVNNVVVAMDESVDEVTQGETLAASAGEAINAIQSATHNVIDLVSNISAATRENSASSQGVARSVEQIARLSEENSNAADRVQRTASDLNVVANNIREQIELFQTT